MDISEGILCLFHSYRSSRNVALPESFCTGKVGMKDNSLAPPKNQAVIVRLLIFVKCNGDDLFVISGIIISQIIVAVVGKADGTVI